MKCRVTPAVVSKGCYEAVDLRGVLFDKLLSLVEECVVGDADLLCQTVALGLTFVIVVCTAYVERRLLLRDYILVLLDEFEQSFRYVPSPDPATDDNGVIGCEVDR